MKRDDSNKNIKLKIKKIEKNIKKHIYLFIYLKRHATSLLHKSTRLHNAKLK